MRFRIFAIMMLIGSLVYGAAWEQKVSAKEVKALISSQKALVVGSNTLDVTLTRQNVPLDGATVEVKAFMPAMPGMPAMESKTNAKAMGKGLYQVSVDLEMHGTWQLFVYVMTKDGKKYRLKTSMTM